MTTDALALISGAVVIIVGAGYYVWYGVALSRLFPRLGAEGWKGWVPILNEMEILVRGGLPAWNIVFSFIPVVSLYGIYLKAIAVHRINESFGKGSGFTILGIFLPPLWASLLAGARMPEPGEYDRRVDGLMAQHAVPAPPAPPLYASAPPPPPAAPVPVSFPSMAAASEPPLFADEPAFPSAPPVAPPAPPMAPPAPPMAAPAPPMAPPAPPMAPPAPPPAAPAPVTAPAREEGSVFNPWAVPAAPAAPAPLAAPVVVAPAPVVDDDDDELDKTVAVDRRPVVPWRLVTDEGHVIPLRTHTVLLGRKPIAPDESIAAVAVPDGTKTLSKNHARLELSDEGAWTVHDLDSTNGVIIVSPDGTETLLPPGGSAPVPGRFLLGKVGMRVSFDDTEATR